MFPSAQNYIPSKIKLDLRDHLNLVLQRPGPDYNPTQSYRQLIVVNKRSKAVVAIRGDVTRNCTSGRITKEIFDLMSDGKHIAYFAHNPTELRVPMKLNGRYYAKPSKYVATHVTIAAGK